jgi:hypothetical protein
MFSQDGHIGNPDVGNFGMIGSTIKANGAECDYSEVLKYDITFKDINGYTNGYQGGGRNK